MKAFIRRRWWSSSEEHFRYVIDSGCYVPDERTSPDSGESIQAANHLSASHNPQKYYAMFLAALSEIRYEFEIQPADEWEAGHLLVMYGAANAAAAFDDTPRRSRSKRLLPARRSRSKHFLTERFLSEVVFICQIVVARHWPDALLRLEAEMADEAPKKAARLNHTVEQLRLKNIPELQTAVNLWLSSFDRPDYGHRETTIEQVEHFSARMETCLDSVRQVLSNAGPTLQAFTGKSSR